MGWSVPQATSPHENTAGVLSGLLELIGLFLQIGQLVCSEAESNACDCEKKVKGRI